MDVGAQNLVGKAQFRILSPEGFNFLLTVGVGLCAAK
jgi:hypothetical protein